jgi:hypothetical protein
METLRQFIEGNPILAATLASLWGAIVVDLFAFASSKEPGSFFSTFSFKVAGWRYLQATVAGFLGNFAIAAGASAVTIALYALLF